MKLIGRIRPETYVQKNICCQRPLMTVEASSSPMTGDILGAHDNDNGENGWSL